MEKAPRPAIFKGRQTEPVFILCAVRWYLRYSLSLRDVEELLVERGLEADHTIWRWVQRYGPELDQRLRRHLKSTNKSWRVDETYVPVKGRWCYLSGDRFQRRHHRLSAVGIARCGRGQTPAPQGTQRSVASSTSCHQHRRSCNLQVGDSGNEEGRDVEAALQAPTGAVLK